MGRDVKYGMQLFAREVQPGETVNIVEMSRTMWWAEVLFVDPDAPMDVDAFHVASLTVGQSVFAIDKPLKLLVSNMLHTSTATHKVVCMLGIECHLRIKNTSDKVHHVALVLAGPVIR